MELANIVVSKAPLGLRGAKKVIDEGLDLSFDEHMKLSYQERLPLNDTVDFQEGIAAFEEKREPKFVGN